MIEEASHEHLYPGATKFLAWLSALEFWRDDYVDRREMRWRLLWCWLDLHSILRIQSVLCLIFVIRSDRGEGGQSEWRPGIVNTPTMLCTTRAALKYLWLLTKIEWMYNASPPLEQPFILVVNDTWTPEPGCRLCAVDRPGL